MRNMSSPTPDGYFKMFSVVEILFRIGSAYLYILKDNNNYKFPASKCIFLTVF